MRRKRIVLLAVITVALTLILTACFGSPAGSGGGNGSVGETVEEINANSNLPMALLTPYEDVRDTLKQDDGLDMIDNFMSADFYADGYMISFAGFPKDDSPYCLATIEVTDGDYDVYGIKVGDDMEQAAQTLQESGYISEDDADEFVKDGVTIALSGDDSGLVEEISIEAPSKYTSGNVY